MSPPLARKARRQAQQDVDWVVIDEGSFQDQEGDEFDTFGTEFASPRRKHPIVLWIVPVALLTVATTLLWMRAEAGLAQMTGEVSTAVQGEALQEQVKAQHPHTAAVVNQVEFQTSVAMAEVVVTDTLASGQVFVRRQMRFYIPTPHGWRRSPPIAAFWGAPETLDTASLHFVYHRLDREVVAQVAPAGESLYRSLHVLLGLPLPAASRLLTVEIVPENVMFGIGAISGPLRLASPYLAYALPDQSRADILEESLRQALVLRLIEAAHTASPPKPQWDLMMTALHSWLLVKAGDGHGTLVQEAGNAQAGVTRLDERPRLEVFLTCVACTTYYPGGIAANNRMLERTAAGSVLVDYLVTRYGVGVLSRLVVGFSRYEDWETLAPAVFGEPAAAVEAAWQQ